jgi:serine protease Do
MARWPVALACLILGGIAGVFVSSNLQGQAPSSTVFPKELTSYREVVKRVLPAVVSVESRPKTVAKVKQQKAPQRRPPNNDMPGLPEEFRRFFEGQEGFDSQMPDVPQHSFGSGFIVDPKGIILTNFHVVAGTDRVEIQLKDGRKFLSTDIKGDRKNDLAIVRINTKEPLPYLELGDSDAMEIGDRVLAVGAPFGLRGTVTAGIVSSKGRSSRDLELTRDRAVYEDYLQTDAAINPGNSGGPLVNLEGKVIGINTAIKSRSGGFQGVGLAITSSLAKEIVDKLVREGAVRRGYLGVSVQELDPDVAARMGVKAGTGVRVAQVMKGTPAAKAGIQEDDVILSVDGKPIHDGRELQHLVARLPLSKPTDVQISRDGSNRTVPVTIEEQPEAYGTDRELAGPSQPTPKAEKEEISVEKIGIEVADSTTEAAARFGFKEAPQGVLITDVQQGSVAFEAGLRRGFVIEKIDNKAVTKAESARTMLEKASLQKGILLKIRVPPALGGGTALRMLKAETVSQ